MQNFCHEVHEWPWTCLNLYGEASTVERGVARVKLWDPGLKGAHDNFAIAK